MVLSVGIVGLPNVGKSTFFKALTNKNIEIANYPFATIDANIGIIEVPDYRLKLLSKVSKSKEIIPSVIEIYDIAGLIKDAHKGEGLGNKFLSHISNVDAIAYMVRAFESTDIQHVENSIDPIRDIEIIRTELALKDMEVIESYLYKVQKNSKGGDKIAQKEVDILKNWKEVLNNNQHICQLSQDDSDIITKNLLKKLRLLTSKQAFFVINSHSENLSDDLKLYIDNLNYKYIVLDARGELESVGMEDSERKEIGMGESVLPRFARTAYEALGLTSFFTTGEKETRAWAVKKDSKVNVAAGVIHTDFEDNFIRANVVHWSVLVDSGGWNKAKEQGEVRTEGKDYTVQDGDVLIVLHGA